jgi:hypothetical protein
MTLEFEISDALEMCDAQGVDIHKRNPGGGRAGYFYQIENGDGRPLYIGPFETPGQAAVSACIDLGLYRVKS